MKLYNDYNILHIGSYWKRSLAQDSIFSDSNGDPFVVTSNGSELLGLEPCIHHEFQQCSTLPKERNWLSLPATNGNGQWPLE